MGIENMQTTLFDSALPDSQAGFRLHRLEVLNWGTFDERVWRIEPSGWNSLLTGDVGSGKSTLVDAITTLLVPHHRIIYNKAAGADSKERTLYSYIRGEYKNEKDNESQTAKPVVLRGQNSYTVVLGFFRNEGYTQDITLAQVFWLKDQGRNPERFFVVAQGQLSIKEHFSNFGTDILDLKRRLRKMAPKVEVCDTFREYSSKFRNQFGIEHEQALELFYQTISMKSVGNLTQFVRLHMLEPGDIQPRIQELRQNFENLNRTHEAVLKAKRQIENLTPIAEEGKKHSEIISSVQKFRNCRDSLESFFAGWKVKLLDVLIQELEFEVEKLVQKAKKNEEEIDHLEAQRLDLKQNIHKQGGERLEFLSNGIRQAGEERDRAQKRRNEYDEAIEALDWKSVRDEASFLTNRNEATKLIGTLEIDLKAISENKINQGVKLQELKVQVESIQSEIASLKQRRSNIPRHSLEIRQVMCKVLGVDEENLPFAGELIQVDEKESGWEGAIERVLHSFGLSLLVSEELYQQVAHYVNVTDLRGKLIYYHANETKKSMMEDLKPKSLVKKLRFKPESQFYSWLEQELSSRFNYVCCESLEEFQRQPFAVTQKGQIKIGGKRHEKDDRRSLHDRSSYVLGWSNGAKILALEANSDVLIKKAQLIADEMGRLEERQVKAQGLRDAARDLLKFSQFQEINWQFFARRIKDLEDEKRAIEESSDLLKTLQGQLKEIEEELKTKRDLHKKLTSGSAVAQDRMNNSCEQRIMAIAARDGVALEIQNRDFPVIQSHVEETFGGRELTLQNLDKGHSEVRASLQSKIDAEDKQVKRLTESLVRQMQQYKNAYPAETKDIDASLEALSEYSAMLGKLKEEDLPRHELRFKELLNEGTINSIALFQNHLERGRKDIEEKIAVINKSLCEIEYNPGTYIELVHDLTQDKEIRDFQQDLKECLSHGLQDESLYNETKFLKVKAILDRLNGRDGMAELDQKWVTKVTDVRNWYEFSASERWEHDDSEKEFYSDSSGKSGGQKEKLAYTVLASALAYQFGLEWNVTRSRSFRFVVIDEAFGRGSDASTRYGLELFKKLNLQLLIVTPLQKIHVIEDYVRSVHYIHNKDSCCSMVRNLTIEEFRAERSKHLLNVTASSVPEVVERETPA